MHRKEEETIDLGSLLFGDGSADPTTSHSNSLDEVLKGVTIPKEDSSDIKSESPIEDKADLLEDTVDQVVDPLPPVSDPKENDSISKASPSAETNRALILDLMEKGTIPTIENLDEIDFDTDFSELLNQIVSEVTSSKYEEILEKESKKTPEILQKALELSKNGGDYLSILEEYKEIVNPIESLNLENEQDQMKALFHYYATFHSGISDEEIIDLIQIRKTKGQLGEASRQASAKVAEYFKEKVDSKLKEAKELESKRLESIKAQKSSIRSILKDKYNLSETLVKKYLDFGYKEEEDGRFQMDKIFEEVTLNNPEVTAKLIILLQDPEGLDKIIESKIDSSVMEKQVKGFRFAKQGKKSNTIIDPQKESRNTNKIEDLSDLFLE